ncbi:uncharacterized protein LOC143085440 [Mytilus galloprovincialis]|uniref:uncharacterized protein LOC143085440 n=1 Tax=Mytilus galloprovincialis TaxID=29158 RepID=UPI003F7CA584
MSVIQPVGRGDYFIPREYRRRPNIEVILQDMESYINKRTLDVADREYVTLMDNEYHLLKKYRDKYNAYVQNIQRIDKQIAADSDFLTASNLYVVLKKACDNWRPKGKTAMEEFRELQNFTKLYSDLERSYGKDGGTYKAIPNVHTSILGQQPKDEYSPRSQSYESPRSDSKALSISYVPIEAYEKLERKLGKQEEVIARKGAEINELRSRIGSISARDSFPEHLSPTKIADKFKNLYEVEWYAAVGLIGTKQGQRRHQTSEEEDYAIYKLLRIIRYGYTWCKKLAAEQLDELSDAMSQPVADPGVKPASRLSNTVAKTPRTGRLSSNLVLQQAKDFRKQMAVSSVDAVVDRFKVEVIKDELGMDTQQLSPTVIKFIHKAAELLWYMCILDPPMYIAWPEYNEPFDTTKYIFYKQKDKGRKVKVPVWPALYLQEKGQLVTKGFAKGY